MQPGLKSKSRQGLRGRQARPSDTAKGLLLGNRAKWQAQAVHAVGPEAYLKSRRKCWMTGVGMI